MYVSAASVWEMAIKVALGKLQVQARISDWIAVRLEEANFKALPIEVEHAAAVERLPLDHTDPFDRLLIAQAIFENLTVVTSDGVFEQYGIPVFS